MGPGVVGLQQTTSYKVVVPFYIYASISLLVGTVLLLFHTDLFHQHHFTPYTLAITHTMALGWGTMLIFGASHQLLPVLISGKLHSNFLAYLTFLFTGIGIPLLVYGFYVFNTGWILKSSAVLINCGVIFYMINVLLSIYHSEKNEVHAWFVAAASIWLFSTTFYGLLLVFNFTSSLLPRESVTYLSIHAHLGLIGWFLTLVIGVGSRLIPMFLISKYANERNLWWIFAFINGSLISFLVFKILNVSPEFYYVSLIMGLIGILLFGNHCRLAYKVRIRKNVDNQMKISLLSVLQMIIPVAVMLAVLALLPSTKNQNLILLYGFCIFFGWITALIFGMTFKTLPFIIWNKVYQKKAHKGKTPAPKELFNERVYQAMSITYISGFIFMLFGIIFQKDFFLKTAAVLLLMAAVFYVYNSATIILHKPKKQ